MRRRYRSYLLLIMIATLFSVLLPTPALSVAGYPDPDREERQIGKEAVLYKLFRAGGGEQAPIGTGSTDAAIYAGKIVRAALVLLGLIFFTLAFYGGSLYLTAGGNEEQVKKAKHVIVRAVIGVIIVLFAGGITQFVINYVSRPVVPLSETQEPEPE